MKRSPELRDLSEQHHYGLVASRALRLAAEGREPLDPAVAAFLAQWEREIEPHFQAEERVLLPEFARAAGESDPLIRRTLAEHAALREAVSRLSAGGPELAITAAELAAALHDHIRFEERILFPAIEDVLTGPALTKLGQRLQLLEMPAHACHAAEPTPSPEGEGSGVYPPEP